MIDPATGWFEIVEIPNKQADEIANLLEQTWLVRHPWPQNVICDRGKEFMAEVSEMLQEDYGIQVNRTTTRNPQKFHRGKSTSNDWKHDSYMVCR